MCADNRRAALWALLGVIADVLAALAIVSVAVALKCIVDPA